VDSRQREYGGVVGAQRAFGARQQGQLFVGAACGCRVGGVRLALGPGEGTWLAGVRRVRWVDSVLSREGRGGGPPCYRRSVARCFEIKIRWLGGTRRPIAEALHDARGLRGFGLSFRARARGARRRRQGLQRLLLATLGAAVVGRDALDDREQPGAQRAFSGVFVEAARDHSEHVLCGVLQGRAAGVLIGKGSDDTNV
jgi:hypothetical protein